MGPVQRTKTLCTLEHSTCSFSIQPQNSSPRRDHSGFFFLVFFPTGSPAVRVRSAGTDSVEREKVLRMGLKSVFLNVSIFIPRWRMYLALRLRGENGSLWLGSAASCQRARRIGGGRFISHQIRAAFESML